MTTPASPDSPADRLPPHSVEAEQGDQSGRVAAKLNNHEQWHSHSRGIPMEVLTRDVKLEIEDFGKNEGLSKCIRHYCKLLSDYMRKLNQQAVVHVNGLYTPL